MSFLEILKKEEKVSIVKKCIMEVLNFFSENFPKILESVLKTFGYAKLHPKNNLIKAPLTSDLHEKDPPKYGAFFEF